MVWKLLTSELQKAIRKRGFGKPSPVQEEGIPAILSGDDSLIIAPTGFGKTESAILPVLDEWVRAGKHKCRPVSILYITPLKSLNRDMLDRILWWSKELGFEVSVRHGDTTQYERGMQSQNPPDMLISTPETLQAMLTGKNMRENISNVRWVIIDEIHEVVENKRGVQLSVALERLKWLVKEKNERKIQLIGLSATIGTPDKVARYLTSGKCRIIDVAGKRKIEISVESPLPTKDDAELSEYMFIQPETAARLRRIKKLIEESNSTLVFTNTREFAEVLSSRMVFFSKETPIKTHHSSLSKEKRIEAEKDFKEGRTKALICTSSLELGIDIGSINLVIQYLSPRQVSKLLQRVGRSGHSMEESSVGVLISGDSDDCFESAAISHFALSGKNEPTKIYGKSLDVLAQQIAGMALDEYNIPLKKAYEIVKGACPFRDLTPDEFRKIADFSQKVGTVWVGSKFSKEDVIRRRKNSFDYYYTNLSTIPDIKNYKVIDVTINKPVGSLDAEFIALHGSPGTYFIMNGQTWRILETGESRVIAEPAGGVEAAIPAWEGELIPVPFEVAQEVGKIRREIAYRIESNNDPVSWVMKNYPVKREVAERMVKTVQNQMKYGVVPDDRTILIESYEDNLIIHACFGSLVNETIGRCLSTLIVPRIGGSVGLQTDPYRIMLKLPGRQWKIATETFYELEPETIEGVLRATLPNTELFHWRFIHVAKRFGIMKRNADYGKGYLKKIIEVYRATPAWEEALHEIFEEKLDIEKSKEVAFRIGSGAFTITERHGLSPLGEAGLIKKYEIVAPDRPESEILKAFKSRLLQQSARLLCCNCGKFDITYRLKNLPDEIKCPICEARLIGVIHPKASGKAKLIKKYASGKTLSQSEMKTVSEILDSASIVLAHGKSAVIALSGRGIGPKAVVRVLEKVRKGSDLYKEILEAEKQYVRTKRFWK
ncbi:MAG: DEAD/DEAH box helicase [Candidatus Micrarchaeota archaeon]|nr:DEAD/DEAH box helicase [Candidatus Micrarchaeota archaeon]